jgi:hypothetical protein
MKERNEKKLWNVAALFIIMLVLTLPIYSAQSLAAVNVQITKNQGEDAIENYIDADGDVWTVEAIISGNEANEVNPEDVVLRIGDNEVPFESCSDSTLGTACEYISPLTEGVKEKTYDFKVVYKFLNALNYPDEKSNGDFIHADGSAPLVTEMSFSQNTEDGNVDAEFIVNDKFGDKPSIGIKTIEIIDADTNAVLQTLGPYEMGLDKFTYSADGGTGGELSGSLFSGEGTFHIKVRAEDYLGHVQTSPVSSFPGDFILPEISNLQLVDFGDFIGPFSYPTDITIDIVEDNRLSSVKAYSDQADLSGEENENNCVDDVEVDGLYHCTWKDIEVNPESSVSVKVIVKDEFGNSAEKTLSASFTSDTSGPSVKFFGSTRVYDDINYIASGKQTIVLEVNEQGAGILEYNEDDIVIGTKGILANLAALGVDSLVKPKECNATSYGAKCFWETTGKYKSAGSAIITLSTFEDNVGNDGEAEAKELMIDVSGPAVEKLKIYGGEKDYFQSNDQIHIELLAVETAGLIVLANLNKIVPDAETKFPATIYMDEPGWQVFTQDECERVEGKWDCSFYTEKIKSGPEDNVKLQLRVQDTAGNDVMKTAGADDKSKWLPAEKVVNAEKFTVSSEGYVTLQFDLLGLEDENAPDYWEVGSVKPAAGTDAIVDLDATPLTYSRMPFTVKLNPLISKVYGIDVNLIGCAPKDDISTIPAASSAISVAPEPAASAEPEVTEEEGAPLVGSATEVPDVEEVPVVEEAEIGTPTISRSLIYGGVNPLGDKVLRPQIVLEFNPFDGREMFNLEKSGGDDFTTYEVDYICKLQIFSRVGDIAIGTGELQDVEISVPFGFTDLGAQDENLKKEVDKAKEKASTGFYGVIKYLNKILKWLGFLVGIVNLVLDVWTIVNVAQTSVDAAYNTPAKEGGVLACFGLSNAKKKTAASIKAIEIPLNILTCNAGYGMPWLGAWHETILSWYNIQIGKSPDSLIGKFQYRPAASIKSNFFLSIIGLCVPGVLENVEKLRQIECRYAVCLEKEVASGLAEVSQCKNLRKVMICKYFVGEVFALIPFADIPGKIGAFIQSMLHDPLSFLRNSLVLTCGGLCLARSSLEAWCGYVYYARDYIDFIESTAGLIFGIIGEAKGQGDYCSAVGL